jgi:Mg-chelatase subunit ChlD
MSRNEIVRHSKDDRIAISQRWIEIRREGKPVRMTTDTGYVYLVVDCSGSMAGDKLNQAKKGALRFAKDALAKGYLTGLIQFDSSAVHLCEPQREISVLDQYLKTMEAGDETHVAKAIHLAHERLKDRTGARVMVIVTDGMPNGPGDPEASLKAGENAKKNGIDIITIGTDDADQKFLKKLASRTELGMKVSKEELEQSIASSAKMLPSKTDQNLIRK